MTRRKIWLLIAGVVAATAVAGLIVVVSHTAEPKTEVQVWWIFTDPHVGRYPFLGEGIGEKPVEPLEAAVRDVNELGIADYALCLGDMVSDVADYAPIFVGMMDNLNVKRWYYILGNHDHDWETGENVLPTVYEGFDVLGIRFILISDEMGYKNGTHISGGVMRENQFDWFFKELYLHRDQPVFVFSHQPYFQWDVWDKLPIATPGEVRVDIWFSGHLHVWAIDENTDYGFFWFGVNSIDWANNYESIFLFIERTGGEVKMTVKARNHLDRVWLDEPYYEFTFEVS